MEYYYIARFILVRFYEEKRTAGLYRDYFKNIYRQINKNFAYVGDGTHR
jgi:hypothetical protein